MYGEGREHREEWRAKVRLGAMGQSKIRIQNERMGTVYFPSNREYSQNFGLNLDRLKQLKKKIIILHPGPINRGVEISSDVADSNQSIILDQVQNGVAIRMAIIYLLGSKLNIKNNV